ncbi:MULTISPECIES: DUF397 domain-containing protein [Streptomyces]|uniref:DUF397 domain-containing protein n=1 Tax=Streptomyces durocortorensis TaxID=2811104 RepID=A0ABS2HSK4_9ACTN|nr:DUF397 domain-containing protein [Streptomyces durocortorensis]MBM7052733.1 DUF397 domain-containing protein [Streptomyces durocortorensis]
MTDLYELPIEEVTFSKSCGGNTHPDGESCVALARIGPDAWALGDSKRPDAELLRFTTDALDAAGIGPARFDLSA